MTIIDPASGKGQRHRGMPESVPQNVPPFISQQVTRAQRFYLDLEPRLSRHLQVLCGGWEEVASDYVIDRPDFPYLSLEFVVSGRGLLRLSKQQHLLEAGTIFSYGPGWAQRIETDRRERLMKYFVNFVGSRGVELLRECGIEAGRVIQVAPVSEVREAFDQLIRLATRPTPLTQRLCALQLELLLLSLVERAAPPGTSVDRSRQAFERCRRIADERFLRLRTARELADAGHVDVAYLCRLFQRFAGTSPYRYLHRLKMTWAAERLHAGGTLVREVADELGVDPFQLSRGFKRVHGLAPSVFQRLRARG